jgi:hypothetical protein
MDEYSGWVNLVEAVMRYDAWLKQLKLANERLTSLLQPHRDRHAMGTADRIMCVVFVDRGVRELWRS